MNVLLIVHDAILTQFLKASVTLPFSHHPTPSRNSQICCCLRSGSCLLASLFILLLLLGFYCQQPSPRLTSTLLKPVGSFVVLLDRTLCTIKSGGMLPPSSALLSVRTVTLGFLPTSLAFLVSSPLPGPVPLPISLTLPLPFILIFH